MLDNFLIVLYITYKNMYMTISYKNMYMTISQQHESKVMSQSARYENMKFHIL